MCDLYERKTISNLFMMMMMMPRPLTCSFDLIQFPINLWSELARFKLRVNKISHIKMQSARHTLKYRIIYFKWFFIQSIVKHEAAKWNEYKMRIQVLLKCAVLSFSILASVIQMIRWIVCLRCVQQNRMVCENALISGLEDWLQFFWVFVSALKMTMLSTKSHEFTWHREKDVSKKKKRFFLSMKPGSAREMSTRSMPFCPSVRSSM